MHAAFKGHNDAVILLIDSSCNVEIRDKDGWTALLHATRRGHTAIVETLIKSGKCNVDSQDNKGTFSLTNSYLLT